jgi:hypothetical protein
MVIEAIGRHLRLAVIGGGPGSVIGEVHRMAARLDGHYDIVASALSSDPERSPPVGTRHRSARGPRLFILAGTD